MKKLHIYISIIVIVLASAVSMGSNGYLFAQKPCSVTCPGVGCIGGDWLCASFDCNGTTVLCFTHSN